MKKLILSICFMALSALAFAGSDVERANWFTKIGDQIVAGGQALWNVSIARLNGVYYIDGIVFPRTSSGVQAAVDKTPTGGAGKIILTNGTYDWTGTVSWLNKGITIEGTTFARVNGQGAYIVVNPSFSGTSVFRPRSSNAVTFTKMSSSHFRNLNIYGNNNATVVAGIYTEGFLQSSIKDVRITGFKENANQGAIILDTAPGCPVSLVHISNVIISNVSKGIWYKDTGNEYHTAITVDGGTVISNIYGTGSAIYVDSSANESSIDMDNVYLESGTTEIGDARPMIGCGAVNLQVHAQNVYFDCRETDFAWDFTNRLGTDAPSFWNVRIDSPYIDSPIAKSILMDPSEKVTKINNVKINALDSEYALEVSGGTGETVYIGSANTTTYQSFANSKGLFGYESSGNNAVIQGASGAGVKICTNSDTFGAASATKVFVKSDGNVGIGTTLPNAKLEVATGVTSNVNAIKVTGNINNYLQYNIQNGNAGATASSDVVATADTGNETTNFIDMGINSSGFTQAVGAALDGYLYTSSSNLILGTTAAKEIKFFTNNANSLTGQRAVITSAGNVGIGTTNPVKSFAVNGEAIIGGSSPVAAIGSPRLTVNMGSEQVGLAIKRTASNAYSYFEIFNESEGSVFRLNENGHLYLNSGNIGVGTSSPRQRIDVIGGVIASGNVGIGTTAPTASLNVVGTVRLNNLTATSGTRYLCVDTSGNVTASATACSGT